MSNQVIAEWLYRMVLALDERRWDDWLKFFAPECEYWVPTWKSEDEQTTNPRRELSLIYYDSRSGLEDRVWRVKSGKSNASRVLPRTQHNLSNIHLLEQDGDLAKVTCNFTVHQYLPKEKSIEIFFGRHVIYFDSSAEGLMVQKFKIILLNDYLPAKIDFYSL
jgi:3-phenylpropionate/cinnamic acid dioxygenase small subunit